jgi:hypothetical protein
MLVKDEFPTESALSVVDAPVLAQWVDDAWYEGQIDGRIVASRKKHQWTVLFEDAQKSNVVSSQLRFLSHPAALSKFSLHFSLFH